MLISLHIGNFKAFGPLQKVPIKPITLIFGPNSAGKSSIIQSLLLAHQAATVDGNLDVHYPKLSGSTVDLGGFAGYVHRHNQSAPVEWAAACSIRDVRGPLMELLAAKCQQLELRMQIGVPLRERMAMQNRLNPHTREEEIVTMPTGVMEAAGPPRVQAYEVRLDGRPVMKLSARQQGVMSIDQVDVRHPVLNESLRACFTGDAAVPGLERVTDEDLETAAREMLGAMSALVTQFLPGYVGKRGFESMDEHLFRASPEALFEGVAPTSPRLFRAISFEFWRLIDGLISIAARTMEQVMKNLQYLGPLRTIPPRDFGSSDLHDPDWFSGGAFAWQVVRENEAIRQKLNRWLGDRDKLNVSYQLRVRHLLDRAELKDPVSRAAYNYDVRSRSGLLGDFRELLTSSSLPPAEQERLLEQLLNRHQDIKASGARMVDPPELDWLAANATAALIPKSELELFDEKKQTAVSHRDVGIGISQVLPVLVAAYGNKGQTVAIEQPEIHVHPAVQAELGDVFIEASLKEDGPRNVFLLETHSEHLILRILRRVRETSSGAYLDEALATADKRRMEEHVPVRPEDLSVLYVEPGDGAAVVKELPVTENGDFAVGWPDGFFTERAKELF